LTALPRLGVMRVYSFESVFAGRLSAMLEFRAARGYKRDTYLNHYIRFDRYCCAQRCENHGLTLELVHEWLESDDTYELARRATAIRLFGQYLDAVGETAYVLPNKYASGGKPKPPYIFTDDEMSALFAAIDRLKPTESEPYLNEIAPVLFRLTYTCGLRPNEGRELATENVNLDTGEVLITHTKRNKERIVVMSDDMLAMSREYDLRRGIFGGKNPSFFPSGSGGPLSTEKVYAAFNKAWGAARRTLECPMPSPVRVYSLRHRFASACLNRWLDNGDNLMAMLPYLRAYMGHDKLNETAYYIHILPENLTNSPGVDREALNAILPEVSRCPD
jgi:integrase